MMDKGKKLVGKESEPRRFPLLIIIVFICFALSIASIYFGIVKEKSSVKNSSLDRNLGQKTREEESLKDYFDEEFSKEGSGDNQADIRKNDPFQEVCGKVSGSDKSPGVSSNTVCFY